MRGDTRREEGCKYSSGPCECPPALFCQNSFLSSSTRRESYRGDLAERLSFVDLRLPVGAATLVCVPYVAGFRRQEKPVSSQSW